jgi:NADH-quinone oxidoreductase subunit H
MRKLVPLNTQLVLTGLALALVLSSCDASSLQEGPIVDVRPQKLQVGDELIVEGPAVKAAPSSLSPGWPRSVFATKVPTVILLEGTFTRYAAKENEPRQYQDRVELLARPIPAASNPSQATQVVALLTVKHRQRLGWVRFEGRVGVEQRPASGAASSSPLWSSSQAPYRLVFFQPSMRSLASTFVEWVNDDRLLAWLGIAVEPNGTGLEITALQSSSSSGQSASSAAHHGLLQGDILLRANGRPLTSSGELSTAFRHASPRSVVTLTVLRGGREFTQPLSANEKPLLLPPALLQLLVMVIFGLAALTLALVISGVLTWVERRVAARIQSRVGPNRVGPQGILQWIADGIKLVLKEDIIPDAVDRPLFRLAPYLVFMGLLGTFVVLPFGQLLIISDLNIGLLYLIAITGFVSLGLIAAGWSSNNKWSLLGGMRSAAQIMSYEIPTGLALMTPVILAGSLSTQTIIERQGGLVSAWFAQGGWPWNWFVFDNPLAFLCFLIYFTSALAEGNRTPFDLPEAESELVAGYQIEYSGWRFAVFMLSEWANLFVIGAVATTVFLGGWQVPGFSLEQQASSLWLQLLGLGIFFAKSMTLVFVIIWIRWTLPRFRIDQMMSLCWKYLVPWAFASLLFVALWVWLAPEWLRLLTQVLTMAIFGGGTAVIFFARVAFNWRQNPEAFSWRPFY